MTRINFFFESNTTTLGDVRSYHLSGKPGVLVLSHPRSGTHLTIDLLRRHFPPLSVAKPLLAPTSAVYVSVDAMLIEGPKASPVRRSVFGLCHHEFPVLKAHWLDAGYENLRRGNSDVANWVQTATRKIYVVRNPLDTIASLYSFEERLKEPIDRDRGRWIEKKSSYWAAHVETWMSRPDVLVLRFEDMLGDTTKTLHRIESWIGLRGHFKSPLLPPTFKSRWRSRLARLSRHPSSTEIKALSPKPLLSELLSPSELQAFWLNVGPVCLKLGYPVPS